MTYEQTLSPLIFGEKEKMGFWGHIVYELVSANPKQTHSQAHSSGILKWNRVYWNENCGTIFWR